MVNMGKLLESGPAWWREIRAAKEKQKAPGSLGRPVPKFEERRP
jgi:hypothetical protein